MIIDFHTHVFPDHVAPAALRSLSEAAGITPASDGTVAGLRAAMRRAGVGVSVLQPVASKAGQVRGINEWVAGLAGEGSRAGDDAQPAALVPFGAIHPELPDLEAEMGRLAARGVRGVKIHPEYQRFSPDEDRLAHLYAAAAEHGMIILAHAGEDFGLPSVRSSPAAFARVLDRFPGLTLVLAHMGGWRQWEDAARHLAGRDVYLDTSFTLPYLGAERFCALVEAHGAERILFGSDGPWADVAAEAELLRGLPLPEAALDAILWRNAARLLGRPGDAEAG